MGADTTAQRLDALAPEIDHLRMRELLVEARTVWTTLTPDVRSRVRRESNRLYEALGELSTYVAVAPWGLPPACECCHGDPLTVCDACGDHACWAGRFMCDDAQGAGTRQAGVTL